MGKKVNHFFEVVSEKGCNCEKSCRYISLTNKTCPVFNDYNSLIRVKLKEDMGNLGKNQHLLQLNLVTFGLRKNVH